MRTALKIYEYFLHTSENSTYKLTWNFDVANGTMEPNYYSVFRAIPPSKVKDLLNIDHVFFIYWVWRNKPNKDKTYR